MKINFTRNACFFDIVGYACLEIIYGNMGFIHRPNRIAEFVNGLRRKLTNVAQFFGHFSSFSSKTKLQIVYGRNNESKLRSDVVVKVARNAKPLFLQLVLSFYFCKRRLEFSLFL